MAKTLGDLRARIANELQIEGPTAADDIDAAIFSSIELYQDEDFWFLDSLPVTVVLTSTSIYSLATILPGNSRIDNISLQYDNDRYGLEYRTPGEFSTLMSTHQGDPVYWTILADNLMIQDVPSRTLTAVVWHSLQRTLTASASAQGVWTNQGEELIRLCAKVDLCTNRLRDYEQAQVLAGRLQMVYSKLHEKTVTRRGARRLRPHM